MQFRICLQVDPSVAVQLCLIHKESIKMYRSYHIDVEMVHIIVYFCNNEKFLLRVILNLPENKKCQHCL